MNIYQPSTPTNHSISVQKECTGASAAPLPFGAKKLDFDKSPLLCLSPKHFTIKSHSAKQLCLNICCLHILPTKNQAKSCFPVKKKKSIWAHISMIAQNLRERSCKVSSDQSQRSTRVLAKQTVGWHTAKKESGNYVKGCHIVTNAVQEFNNSHNQGLTLPILLTSHCGKWFFIVTTIYQIWLFHEPHVLPKLHVLMPLSVICDVKTSDFRSIRESRSVPLTSLLKSQHTT